MNKFLPLKQRLFMLIGGMALLVALISGLVIFPTVRRIDSVGDDIYQTEKFMEAEYLRARELKKSIASIEDITRTTHIFERAVIHQGEELRVITELESLADKHHISQSLDVAFTAGDAKASGKKRNARLPYFTFSFVNHGEFSNMVRHLRALEQLPYYIFIDTLSWERERTNRRGAADGALTLRYTAKIYAEIAKE